MSATFKIPFGKAKGKLITEAELGDLKWTISKIAEKLEADPKKAYADKDRAWLTAARAEAKRREGGGEPTPSKPPPQSQALAKSGDQTPAIAVAGAWNEAVAVDAELRKAAESMHLVSPATVCGALPEGCEVALSLVHVNPDAGKDGPGEVYPVGGGKLGLSGTTLKRIGAAAGVDWDMERTGRLDNGRDPHYCHYRAVGTVRNFDGSIRTVSGEVEMDLRDGSPQVDEIRKKAADREDKGDSQILEMRKFLIRHAESKAKNRAIADMGLKRSYRAEELGKPFAVARLMATGRSNDPELRREFARMNFDKMTSGRAALYGAPSHAAPLHAPPGRTLPAAPERALPPFQGHEPPPLAAAGGDDDEVPEHYDYEAEGDPASEPSPAAAQPAQQQMPLRGAAADGGDMDRGDNPNRY